MRSIAERFCVLVVCAVVLAGTSHAASVFGRVRCLVHDAQHRAVPGALVELSAQGSDWSRAVTTDANGEAEFGAVPPGRYRLTVSLAGSTAVRQAVAVYSDAAPVHHVVLDVAGVVQGVTVSAADDHVAPPATPTSLVDRDEIAATPGAGRANGVQAITSFVPGAYVIHDQLHVRGGHQIEWLVDGVPVPNTNIASNVGPQFDPGDADSLEVLRGSDRAEHGDRAYAVVNVVPRTGFERDNEADVLVSAGSFRQTNDRVSIGGHTQRLAYYASANGNRSDLGLQTPVAAVIHDKAHGLGGFGSVIFNPTPGNQLRFVASARGDGYQVPNDEEGQRLGAADTEHESDLLVNGSWVRSFGPRALLIVSPFYHRNTANYDGSGRASPVATVHRTSRYAGAQATLEISRKAHDLRAGLYGFHQADDQAFALALPEAGHEAFSVRDHPSGRFWALFAEEVLRVGPVTVSGGVRHSGFAGGLAESATTPRVGVSVRVPGLAWTVRAFYGRYYQPPPLLTVSGALLAFVAESALGVIPLRGERDEEYQAGLAVPLRGWVIDGDVFRTRARNFFDHDSVGDSNVFLPLTIDRARIEGAEVTVRSPRTWKAAGIHLAYANLRAEGNGGVSGGLTDFSAPAGAFLLDHDQRHTLSAGVDGRFGRGFSASANLYYGSGFPDRGGPRRLSSHTTLDAMVGKNVGERLVVSITVLNATNRHLLIDRSPTFGGTHFNHPREMYVQARYRFHY